MFREIRKPSNARLRWGKRSDDFLVNFLHRMAVNELEDELQDEANSQYTNDATPEQNNQFIDRSYNVEDKYPAELTEEQKRAPAARLRWGRSFPSSTHQLTGVCTKSYHKTLHKEVVGGLMHKII